MANEIEMTASLSVNKAAVMSDAFSRSITNFLATMSGNFITYGTVSIATSETAIPMGQVVQPNWAVFYNADSTNFIKLRVATSGSFFAQLYPGAMAFIPLPIAMTAPYAIADTAACILEYLIISK